MTYLKGYMAKVTKHMEENGKKDQVDSFKANINKVMKELLGRFKDLEFYCGESMDPDAMVLILGRIFRALKNTLQEFANAKLT